MRLTAILFGLSVLVGATTARAEGMFETFDATCLKTQAVSAAALAVADGRGWAVMPQEVAANLAKGFGKAKTAFQGRINAADRRGIVVGDVVTSPEDGNLTLSSCIVVGAPPAGESILSEAAAFAAVPANPSLKPSDPIFYSFTEDAGKHVQILHPEADSVTLPLMKSGRMRVVVAMSQPQLSLLAFAQPAKSPN